MLNEHFYVHTELHQRHVVLLVPLFLHHHHRLHNNQKEHFILLVYQMFIYISFLFFFVLNISLCAMSFLRDEECCVYIYRREKNFVNIILYIFVCILWQSLNVDLYCLLNIYFSFSGSVSLMKMTNSDFVIVYLFVFLFLSRLLFLYYSLSIQ